MSHLPRWTSRESERWHSLQIPPAHSPCFWPLWSPHPPRIPFSHTAWTFLCFPMQAQSPNPTTARDVASPLPDAPTSSESSSGTASSASDCPQSKQEARLDGSRGTERREVGAVGRVRAAEGAAPITRKWLPTGFGEFSTAGWPVLFIVMPGSGGHCERPAR